MKILALDLGKFKSVCCFFDTKTRKAEFLTAATDRHYLSTIFKKRKVDLVVSVSEAYLVSDLAQQRFSSPVSTILIASRTVDKYLLTSAWFHASINPARPIAMAASH